jgi:hypothetical protein
MSRIRIETGRLRARRTALAGLTLVGGLALGGVLLPSGGAAQPQTAPSNTGEPRVSGTPAVGQRLTTSNGTWSGSTPMTFSYQWLRCPKDGGKPDGSNCGVISGGTKSGYVVANADTGSRLRVRVTAKNADGSASAASNPTEIVTAGKPSNTSPPTISGTPEVGQTLTAHAGTWTGRQPISLATQWRRCASNGGSCSDVRGATSQTYKLQSADKGQTLRIRVTARNSLGSASTTSAATAVIEAPPPTGCPSGAVARVNEVTPPARLIIDRLQFSPSVVTRSTNSLVARFHVVDTCGQPVQGALVYATAVPFNQLSVEEQPTGKDGWVQINFRVLSSFPVSRQQGLLVLFTRARKLGENPLAGISNRRLVSVRVQAG